MTLKEVVELIAAGIGAEWEDDAERPLMRAVREAVVRGGKEQLLAAIDQWLADYWEARGRCSECGGETEERVWKEARPYGSTVALETMGERACLVCGTVA